MIHYILQTVAFQLLFLAVYDLFLKRETFFHTNRLYLLATPVLSLLLPFVKIPALRERIPEEFAVQLPAIILGEGTAREPLTPLTTDITLLSWQNLWLLGMLFGLIFFGIKLARIYRLKRLGSVSRFEKFSIVRLPGSNAAFSFFRDIFLGTELSEEQQENMLLHEKVHVQQKHTWDLLFFECLRVLFWFNPLIYVFQQRMTSLQEYIADREVVLQKPPALYYQALLSQVFQTEKISFINTFYNRSLIKNRILMLRKTESKKIVQLKYLLVIPVLCGMLLYTSCSNESDANNLESEADLIATTNTEVMTKINELSEAIMKKGNLTEEEWKALKFLATEAGSNDKVYGSVKEYLDQANNLHEDSDEFFPRNNVRKFGTDVPFAVIDKAPTFPGCENSDRSAEKKCTTQKIGELVASNFNTKVGNSLDLGGRSKIYVQFKIDTNGAIVDVRARGPHPDLEVEAIQAVKTIPKMIPGEHKGKKVSVLYALPIIFELDE